MVGGKKRTRTEGKIRKLFPEKPLNLTPILRTLLGRVSVCKALNPTMAPLQNPSVCAVMDLCVISSSIVRAARGSHFYTTFLHLSSLSSDYLDCENPPYLCYMTLVRCHGKYSPHVRWFRIRTEMGQERRSIPSLSPNSLFLSTDLLRIFTVRLSKCNPSLFVMTRSTKTQLSVKAENRAIYVVMAYIQICKSRMKREKLSDLLTDRKVTMTSWISTLCSLNLSRHFSLKEGLVKYYV